MTLSFSIKPIIKASLVNLPAVIADLEKELTRQTRRAELEMLRPTKTWDHQVTMGIRKVKRLHRRVTPTGEGRNQWLWVSRGTRVRHARMTPDFVAKTRPGSLFAGRGRGGFSHFEPDLPGIEAREFEEQVVKKLTPSYRRQMRSVYLRSLKTRRIRL